MIVDLVCGMKLTGNDAKYSLVFEGETYFFCSEGCRAEFRRHPEDYSQPAADRCHQPLEEKTDV